VKKEGRDHLEVLDVDGRLILKCTLKKEDVNVLLDSNLLMIGPNGRLL
jgi:hypothetical protein